MAEGIGHSNGNGHGGRLSTDEAVQLTGQIAALTRSGLPLPSGLRALGEEVPLGALRHTLNVMARSIEEGATLDEAILAQGKRLPGHVRGLVQVGARTGRIGEVLAQFAGYATLGIELRRKLWLSLAYPLISIVLAIAVFFFACVVLMGSFKVIFKDFGIVLPLLSRMMIKLSDLLTMTWRPVLEVVAGVVALWLVVHWTVSAPVRRSMASRVPLIGPIWRWTSLSEFCHLLGLLLEAELAMPEALPLAGEGVQDADLQAACRLMARDVASGQSVSRAFQGRSIFPQALGRILAWAEGHRSLPEAMHMAGEMFESRARSQATFAGTVLGVLSVVIIIGGISLVIPAAIVPMINLIQKLSG